MIGVTARPEDHAAAREFFELFKTPWEFWRPGRRYDVLLCTDGRVRETTARLVLIYAGDRIPFDAEAGIPIHAERAGRMLASAGNRVPIYGKVLTFRSEGPVDLKDEPSRQSAAHVVESGSGVLVRIGYDLFREVHGLLAVGQPSVHASIPAMEMHIDLLRALMVEWAAPLAEIPPVPDGYRFMACLTHDIDHPSIRRHKWDRTMVGFLYRAMVGSVINVLRGRASLRDLLTNWTAVGRLPLVYLGLATDFWSEFDRYVEIEQGLNSTFFVIPFADRSGRALRGRVHRARASKYGARDIADHIRRLASRGCEVGVHGIDAWLDSAAGGQELRAITQITNESRVGIRMHWLYAGPDSSSTLERAGFAYDSTVGYNNTVGYRAGTTQVFKPLDARRLLELPLHVMDTALFYPCHLNLSPGEAHRRLEAIVDNAMRFGGTITINWHDRSIAPERLWGAFYVSLIQDLKSRGAWFPTAARAVAWFQKRRSVVFESCGPTSGRVRARVSAGSRDDLPGLRLRLHTAPKPPRLCPIGARAPEHPFDVGFSERVDIRVPRQDRVA